MLNLPIAMLSAQKGRFLLLLFVLLAGFQRSWSPAARASARMQQATQTPPEPTPVSVRIAAPGGGEALQGVVSVLGMSDVPGFRSAEVSFAYQNNPTGTWFLIEQSSTPVKDGPLAGWDTTSIADGVYRLRLLVFLSDGRRLESVVTGLRVRNYSPVETSTPGPKPGSEAGTAQPVTLSNSPTPTITPTFPDFQVTPRAVTPLPANPIQVTSQALRSSAALGVAVVVGILAVFGVYLGLRALGRR